VGKSTGCTVGRFVCGCDVRAERFRPLWSHQVWRARGVALDRYTGV